MYYVCESDTNVKSGVDLRAKHARVPAAGQRAECAQNGRETATAPVLMQWS